MFTEKEELLHLERSGKTAVKVRHVFDEKDQHFIDIRKFYKSDGDEWLPERKGIMLRLEEASQVASVLGSP